MNKKALNFPDVVEWLDSLKTLHYLCRTVREYASPVRSAAVALEEELDYLGYLPIRDAMARLEKDAKFVKVPRSCAVTLRTDLPLAAEFRRILEEAELNDRPFYSAAGFGKYWNEVCLPAFIDKLFDSVVAELMTDWPGLLGTEDAVGRAGLKDGMIGIAYYDLSDILLVFQDMEAAERFEEKNAVEPSCLLQFWDEGWQSM